MGFGLVVWPLGAVSQESAADPASAPTYAELAQKEVGASFEKLVNDCKIIREMQSKGDEFVFTASHEISCIRELSVFRRDVLPHQTKVIRKNIAGLKGIIDIFPYVYPVGSGADLFLVIRKKIDRLYGTAGGYKDLWDVQNLSIRSCRNDVCEGDVLPEDIKYDLDEMKHARDLMQRDVEALIGDRVFDSYKSYLNNPVTAAASVRPKEDLSRFFWGSVDHIPHPSDNGHNVLRFLVAGMLDLAHDGYPVVANMKGWETLLEEMTDPHTGKEVLGEEIFHDMRKRMRSANRLAVVARSFGAQWPQVAEQEKMIDEMVGLFGAVEDGVVAHHINSRRLKAIDAEMKDAKGDKLKDLEKRRKNIEISLNKVEDRLDRSWENLHNAPMWQDLPEIISAVHAQVAASVE